MIYQWKKNIPLFPYHNFCFELSNLLNLILKHVGGTFPLRSEVSPWNQLRGLLFYG